MFSPPIDQLTQYNFGPVYYQLGLIDRLERQEFDYQYSLMKSSIEQGEYLEAYKVRGGDSWRGVEGRRTSPMRKYTSAPFSIGPKEQGRGVRYKFRPVLFL